MIKTIPKRQSRPKVLIKFGKYSNKMKIINKNRFIYMFKQKFKINITYKILKGGFYNFVIKRRVVNKATNFGNMYFENTYNIIKINPKTNVTWLMK